MRKNRILAAVFIFAIACGLLVYDSVARSFWQGTFPLDVQIKLTGNRAITQVSFGTLGFDESAEKVLGAIQRDNLSLPTVVEFENEQFRVHVPCGGHTSGLGRELSYGQDKLLALKFEFANGQSKYKVVEIPDGRTNRTVSVVVPE